MDLFCFKVKLFSDFIHTKISFQKFNGTVIFVHVPQKNSFIISYLYFQRIQFQTSFLQKEHITGIRSSWNEFLLNTFSK